MTLKRNIFANYIGAGAAAAAPILALPWYLAALGPKQYGLISFVAMLQSLLALLDAGLSQALVREFAIRTGDSVAERQRASTLLFGFERIYWLFALGAGGITIALAQPIAVHWLNLGGLPEAVGQYAVWGAAAIFAAQFPGSIYRSVLIGTQAHVALNGTLFAGTLLRHAGGVAVVTLWPNLYAYLSWQATAALLETLLRGWLAWRTLGRQRGQVHWNWVELRPVWRLAVYLSGATVLGALTVQMDKIVLSRMASIEQLGYYSIAATVSLGSLQLVYPLMQAVLPRAIHLRDDPAALRALNLKVFALIAMLCGTGALVFWAVGRWLLTIWLSDAQAVAQIYPWLAVLLTGTALNAFYNVGYTSWLAREQTHKVLAVNAISFVASIVLLPYLIARHGTIGAAFGWLAMNLIGFALSLEWLKRSDK
jgi:O-antigen/teichoic acid export membrane protein